MNGDSSSSIQRPFDLTVAGQKSVLAGGRSDEDAGTATRLATFVYGVIGYIAFAASLGWFVLFVGDLLIPYTINQGRVTGLAGSIAINIGLVLLFGVQHSVMARPWFKRALTSLVPAAAERSTYVLASAGALAALCAFWRPMPTVVWETTHPVAVGVLWGAFAYGWLLLAWASFMIDHFDLFGLRQVTLFLKRRPYSPVPFQITGAYRYLRHPIMVGTLVALWSAPRMSQGRLLLALTMAAYVLLGIFFEERGLAQDLGEPYRRYRRQVPAFIPDFLGWARRNRDRS